MFRYCITFIGSLSFILSLTAAHSTNQVVHREVSPEASATILTQSRSVAPVSLAERYITKSPNTRYVQFAGLRNDIKNAIQTFNSHSQRLSNGAIDISTKEEARDIYEVANLYQWLSEGFLYCSSCDPKDQSFTEYTWDCLAARIHTDDILLKPYLLCIGKKKVQKVLPAQASSSIQQAEKLERLPEVWYVTCKIFDLSTGIQYEQDIVDITEGVLLNSKLFKVSVASDLCVEVGADCFVFDINSYTFIKQEINQ